MVFSSRISHPKQGMGSKQACLVPHVRGGQGRWRKQSTPEPAGLPHAQVVQGHFQGQQDCGAMKGEGGGALGMDTQTLWLNENMFHERESLADTGCL